MSRRPGTIPCAVSPHPASGTPKLVPATRRGPKIQNMAGSLLRGQEGHSLSLSGSEPTADRACTSGTRSFWEEAPTSAPLRPNSFQYTAPASLVIPRVPPAAAASRWSASVPPKSFYVLCLSPSTTGYLASLTANLWARSIS